MIDTSRHFKIFPGDEFEKRVDIIGCGAVGSHLGLQLAKLGVKKIHLWDFDNVEEHNIANQAFSVKHVGKPKVDALAEIIKEYTGIEPECHNEKVDGTQPLGNVVFMNPDTMASRKEIWEKAVRHTMVELLIESRMGADSNRVYSIVPTNPLHIKKYEKSFSYDDSEAEESLCGARTTVGPTAMITACQALWQLIRWHNYVEGKEGYEMPESELITAVNPHQAIGINFK